MRPERLVMQAFGPYAKKEEIDFTQLKNRTMFVISGDTGAGKTTIFDAISYAFYGVASGDDRSSDDLRSHFAKDDCLTEVELIFSLHGKRFKIYRSPRQKKKKVNGDGYTDTTSKAELYKEVKGDWQIIAANITSVEETVKQLIGLEKDQFRQILMIPQGEFRKLLVSDSRDKEKILRKLFNTQLYGKITLILKEQSKALRDALKEINDKQQSNLTLIQALKNDELKTLVETEQLNYLQVMPLLEEEMESEKNSIQQLVDEIKNEEVKFSLANTELALAKDLQKRFETVEQLRKQLEQLENEKTVIEEIEKDIELINNAQLLAKDEEIGRNIRNEKDRLENELSKNEIALKTIETSIQKVQVQLNELVINQPEVNKKKIELQTLAILKDEVLQLKTNEDELIFSRKEIETKQKQLKVEQDSYKEVKDKITQLEEHLKGIQQTKDQVYQLNNELLRLENEYRIIEEYEKVGILKANALASYKKESVLLDTLQKQLEQARIKESAMEKLLIQSQAAILADKLEEGCACPVCGSKEHPDKAHITAAIPNEEELEQLKEQTQYFVQEIQSLQGKLNSYQTEAKLHDTRLNELHEKSSNFEWKNTNDIKEVITLKKSKIAESKKLIEQSDYHSKQLEQFKQKLITLEQLINDYIPSIQKLETSIHLLNQQIQQLLQKLPNKIQSYEQFHQQVEALQNEIISYDNNLKQLEEQHQKLKEQQSASAKTVEFIQKELQQVSSNLVNEQEKFKKNMLELGFANGAAYKKIVEKMNQKEALVAQVKEFTKKYENTFGSLQSMQKEIENKQKPDLITLTNHVLQLEKQLNKLKDEKIKLENALIANEKVVEKTKRYQKEFEQLEQQYKIIGELSDIADGQGKNQFKISFERYVLGYFLDEILIEANNRLAKMTNGRFKLIRKKDLNKGKGPAGLDLLIYDIYTSSERPVQTLSGGESFKASLSLALGLSDVVSQNAGGISLETIFIDEGFGTLDNESLNQAIDTLMEIQTSGRLVGIISHVDQLKESIDARLEVIGSSEGSSTKFVFSTTTT